MSLAVVPNVAQHARHKTEGAADVTAAAIPVKTVRCTRLSAPLAEKIQKCLSSPGKTGLYTAETATSLHATKNRKKRKHEPAVCTSYGRFFYLKPVNQSTLPNAGPVVPGGKLRACLCFLWGLEDISGILTIYI